MSYLIVKTHKLENVNYFGTVIYHCVCCNKLAKFSESFESIVCYPLKETKICHVNCAECAEGEHGCNNSDCKCFVQERAPEIEKILEQAKDKEQQQQDHEKRELQSQISCLKAICEEQKKVLENCIIYTIEEYHPLTCQKQHEVGFGQNGGVITEPCGQPIRCARTIREVTFSKAKAIAATKDKPNWSYVEHRVN